MSYLENCMLWRGSKDDQMFRLMVKSPSKLYAKDHATQRCVPSATTDVSQASTQALRRIGLVMR